MHAFGNVLDKILSFSFPKTLVAKSQEIVSFFKNSHIPAARLRDKLILYRHASENNRGLVKANQTRMTSVQMCIESILNNIAVLREIVNELGTSFTNDRVRQSVLDNLFEYQLKELNSLILPFSKFIITIQGKISRLSDVSRYWIYLTNETEKFLNRDIPIVGIDEFKTSVRSAFNAATGKIPVHECSIALFLDPRYRVTVTSREVSAKLQLLVLRFARDRGITSLELQLLSQQLAAYHQDQDPFSTFSYGGPQFDPRQWWEAKCHPGSGTNELAKIAVLFFSIPASAAGPERLFSLFDWMQSKRRNNISLRKLAMMASIKQYYEQEVSILDATSATGKRTASQQSSRKRAKLNPKRSGQESVVSVEEDGVASEETDGSEDDQENEESSEGEGDLNLETRIDEDEDDNSSFEEGCSGLTTNNSSYALAKLEWFDYHHENFSLASSEVAQEKSPLLRQTSLIHAVSTGATLNDEELLRFVSDANGMKI